MNEHMAQDLAANIRVAAWADDFVCALRERSFLIRLCMRLLIGRWAFRELMGLIAALRQAGYAIDAPYMLHGKDYHQDPMPYDIRSL